MPFDTSGLQTVFAQYGLPIMIVAGVAAVIWLALAVRALRAHMNSEAGRFDSAFLKNR
jgi:hypothetical protein